MFADSIQTANMTQSSLILPLKIRCYCAPDASSEQFFSFSWTVWSSAFFTPDQKLEFACCEIARDLSLSLSKKKNYVYLSLRSNFIKVYINIYKLEQIFSCGLMSNPFEKCLNLCLSWLSDSKNEHGIQKFFCGIFFFLQAMRRSQMHWGARAIWDRMPSIDHESRCKEPALFRSIFFKLIWSVYIWNLPFKLCLLLSVKLISRSRAITCLSLWISLPQFRLFKFPLQT